MTPETKLKRSILRYLAALKKIGEPIRWRVVYSGTGFGKAGEPDLDIVYRGRAVKLEIKAGKRQPTKLQVKTMDEIRGAEGIAEVVRSAEEVVEILKRIDASLLEMKEKDHEDQG